MELTPNSHHDDGTPAAEVDTNIARASNPSRRAPRIRTACVRCQRRKIKCDERVPSCSSCGKAGVTCVDGGKQQDKGSRAYITSLQSRVKWLESLLAENCPEIDLSSGPDIVQDDNRSPAAPAEFVSSQHSTYLAEHTDNFNPATTKDVSHTSDDQPNRLAHEIGLVSVTGGQDPRYIGPSSGYSFAKLILSGIGLRNASHKSKPQSHPTIPTDAFKVAPSEPPKSIEYAVQLSVAYWDNIHCQDPFLHRPTHLKLIKPAYSTGEQSPIVMFQVYMVLAISSTILSRRLKSPLPAEGYCASAMTYFDRIQIEGSLEGLQCLLLLQMYGMNNPSMGFNLWYLNYQCIANVLDLGLQRDIRASKNLSYITQEMRTRIFWVVYSIDRTLATIMGRPIGLRDEACELRMPADVDDDALLGTVSDVSHDSSTSNTMAFHLIKLAQINSEIKYIANSISHKTPAHSYPQVPDVNMWQRDVVGRLDQWLASLPQLNTMQTKICEIEYHKIIMLLLRPSPAIRHPSIESLQRCHQSAISTIRGFEEQYRADQLLYNWPTVHSVFLASVSMLFCIWTVPSIAKDTKIETFSADLNSASQVLCALAEHWVDAKRGRDVLDELSHATIRWIAESQKSEVTRRDPRNTDCGVDNVPIPRTRNVPVSTSNGEHENRAPCSGGHINSTSPLEVTLGSEFWNTSFGISDGLDFDFGLDSLMRGVFSDYPLDLDFGPSLPLENQKADHSIL